MAKIISRLNCFDELEECYTDRCIDGLILRGYKELWHFKALDEDERYKAIKTARGWYR